MERETPLPIEPLIREKFSCNIQKDKPLYWNTLYNMEDESEIYDSIIFSYVLRGERKFYNVFFKNELYRLFRDIKETTSSKVSTSSKSSSDSSEPIDEFNRDIKNINLYITGISVWLNREGSLEPKLEINQIRQIYPGLEFLYQDFKEKSKFSDPNPSKLEKYK